MAKKKSIDEINRLRLIRYEAERSFLFFCMYMFKENNGTKFIPYRHVQIIASYLEKVASGDIKRLIINIPPRFGKTEIAVKMLIAWGLALNERAKFIHLSYSADLALDNSAMAKEYIQSSAFQDIWNMDLKVDAQGKQKWFNRKGGGCYATSTGGAITGFGAGSTESINNKNNENTDNKFKNFGGAIIIDDPNKPDDAFSDIKRNFINQRYNNTIRSRVNSRETPIVVIQQRLHETDLSGFLLDGGSGEKWVHLNLPALNDKNEPLCPEKFTYDELIKLKDADPYTFGGQYMQNPTAGDGGIWKVDWFEIIRSTEMPRIDSWQLYIDGAYTKNVRNDPTGLMVAAKAGKNLYILSAISKYMEMPELLKFIPNYISSLNVNVNAIIIEPKASGLSMAQLLRNETNYNIIELKGKILREGKEERASQRATYIESGRVKLINGKWNNVYLDQIGKFPKGKHDEYVDLTCFAIDRELFEKSRPKIFW